MTNYPVLKTSTNFECLGDYGVTDSIRNRLKLVVTVPESLYEDFEVMECGFLLLSQDLKLSVNDLIFLPIVPDDSYHDHDIDSGMGALVSVYDILIPEDPKYAGQQWVVVHHSNLLF